MKKPQTTPPVARRLVHITLVLDKSGSMGGTRNDTIGSVNQYIKDQRADDSTDCTMAIVQFDSRPHVSHETEKIGSIELLNENTYRPNGNTALFDAVMYGVREAEKAPASAQKLVVIVTDGEENSSHEFTSQQVKTAIDAFQATGKWGFVFLGADQNSWQVGTSIGVPVANSMTYTSNNPSASFGAVNSLTSSYRISTASAPGAAGGAFVFDTNNLVDQTVLNINNGTSVTSVTASNLTSSLAAQDKLANKVK